MAQNRVNVRLITRNDTAANWKEKDPILMLGEFGFETDTGLIKVGDDHHPWSELNYINDLTSVAATHYEGTAQLKEDGITYQTDLEVITEALGENTAEADDICIVKRIISGEKISYTAYIYDGKNWTALDGNYNAENVYFSEDFTVTANIGAVEIPEGESNTTVKAAGKNLKDVLASILAERKYPSKTAPTVIVKLTSSTSVEVGTTVTPTYEASLDAGSYTYGPATGITATTWSITDNASTPNTATTATGSFPAIVVGDSTNYKVTATATYDDGTIPVDNLGDEYPEGQIKGSSASATVTTALKGYRNYFYGVLATTTAEAPIDNALIRGLTKGVAGGYTTKRTFSMEASSVTGAKRMIIAYPANAVTATRKGLTSVILPNSLNFDAVANGAYKQQANVEVEGANGYDKTPYIVWLYEPDSIDSSEIHNATLA